MNVGLFLRTDITYRFYALRVNTVCKHHVRSVSLRVSTDLQLVIQYSAARYISHLIYIPINTSVSDISADTLPPEISTGHRTLSNLQKLPSYSLYVHVNKCLFSHFQTCA